MEIERRSVLGGLAALGLAGAVGRPDKVAAASPKAVVNGAPAVVLVGSGAEHSGFLHGIEAAGSEILDVIRPDFGLGFLQQAGQMLRERPDLRLLGLVDDASAAVIIGLARATGARQQWLANHWVGDGRSRHVILSADLAEGCASRLGRHLAACGGDFDLLERSPPGQEPHLRITGSARDSAMKRDNWAAATGFLLASRGGGHVDDERLGALPAASGRGLSGHFVSLSLGN